MATFENVSNNVQTVRNAQKAMADLLKAAEKYQQENERAAQAGMRLAEQLMRLGEVYQSTGQWGKVFTSLATHQSSLENSRLQFSDDFNKDFVRGFGFQVRSVEENVKGTIEKVSRTNEKFESQIRAKSRVDQKNQQGVEVPEATKERWESTVSKISVKRKEMHEDLLFHMDHHVAQWVKALTNLLLVKEAESYKQISTSLEGRQSEWGSFLQKSDESLAVPAPYPNETWSDVTWIKELKEKEKTILDGIRQQEKESKKKGKFSGHTAKKFMKKKRRETGGSVGPVVTTISSSIGAVPQQAGGYGPTGNPGFAGGASQQQELVQAIYEYTAVTETELTLAYGDVITVLEKTDDVWWEGQLGEKIGYFPKDYVEPYNAVANNGSQQFQNQQNAVNYNQPTSAQFTPQPVPTATDFGSMDGNMNLNNSDTTIGVAVSTGDTTGQEAPAAVSNAPWEKYATDEGDIYYYNAETGESSWEPPATWVE
eukprot:CAMPEP_0174255328 /NCGR_PEP_ID=MMETSP0439-20130205/4674_1 /TAXON_ID=0 /ORGANISM="Stereomyxa ramosa, Strain Chinc5" /LENGTH=482 /DNA_ID=CAMNT_0015337461 /DNA_START=36 /DNA_END=1484 /DNA_ORIENTATION=-